MWSWVLAFRNLGRNRKRSLATGLAIMAGFIGLTLISAYFYRAKRALETSTVYLNHKGHIAFFKHGSLDQFAYRPTEFLISKEEQNKVVEILQTFKSEIDFTGRYLTGMGLVTSEGKSTPFLATGVEPETYQKILHHKEVLEWTPDWVFNETVQTTGKLIENSKLVSLTKQMGELIGKTIPFDAGTDEERYVQLIAKNYFGDLNVVDAELGLRHTTGMSISDDTSLYTSLEKLQELFATEDIQYWSVFLKEPSKVKSLVSKIQDQFNREKLNIDAFPFTDSVWGAYYVGTMGFLFVISCFFSILICGSVILSVYNTTTLGIYERNTEIGTLRATGFNSKSIYTLFWKENLILSIVSIIVGYLLSEAIAFIVNSAEIRFRPPGTQGDVKFVLITQLQISLSLAILVLCINFVSTMIAVRRSTKTSIVDLLASTGG